MPLQLSDTAWRYLETVCLTPLRNGTPKDWKLFTPDIALLSEHFSRPNLRNQWVREKYLNNPRLRQAYRLYFMTANMLKIHPVLDELALSGFFENHPVLRILDLGSGTGTLLVGFLTWLEKRQRANTVSLTAVDYAADMLSEIQSSFESFWNVPVRTITADLRCGLNNDDTYDLIFAGNVLNELTAESMTDLSRTCRQALNSEGYLICIEPALKDTSRTLLHFRNLWIENGGSVYAPCCTQIACPALQSPDDWCHHDVPWVRPEFIRYFDDQIGLIKKSLKFSYMILTHPILNSPVPDAATDFRQIYRVVSELFNEKGRYRVYLCNDDGRRLVEKNKRDDTPSNHTFNSLNRYDVIYLYELFNSGKIGRIQPHTIVRKIREGWVD